MRRDDRGTVTAFVAAVAIALLVTAGLVVDGGRIVAARIEAGDAAAAAARAGAQEVVGVRAAVPSIDPARARAAALAFLAASGRRGAVEASSGSVTVTVAVPARPALLGLVGLGPRTVYATRTARPVDR